MMKCKLAKSVMDLSRINQRILFEDLRLLGKVVTLFSVYGSQSGRSEEDNDKFYNNQSTEMQSKKENCIALEDFNGHVISLIHKYEEIRGGYGRRIRNVDGEKLEFTESFDMVVGHTFFKKDSKKLITIKTGGNSSIIDYVVIKKEVTKRVRDVKII